MLFKPVILWTDSLIYVLVIALFIFIFWARKQEHLRQAWQRIIRRKLAVISLVILIFFAGVGFLDSLHYRSLLDTPSTNTTPHYSVELKSVLDKLLSPLGTHDEKTYSAPFATHLYVKETIEKADGVKTRAYPRLQYGGAGLLDPQKDKAADIIKLSLQGALIGIALWLLITLPATLIREKTKTEENKSDVAWMTFLSSIGIIVILSSVILSLAQEYHVLGTNKVGQDILYLSLKSIRTGLVIGSLTTLIMLPFALFLGTAAGYFGGKIDDIIQYIYITLSSIPGVLLIAAAILSLQIFIANHADLFPTLAERADMRLLALCLILGVSSWTGLCRLLRGESLRLREVDYVQAARAVGVGHGRIILKHILPNVMHIVMITIVLDFSGLVLAEAVLSYVGVGVDPSSISWGNMINGARLELAREPIVWWPLLAAFVFMFSLVLAANLFADAVRDAFDPRLQHLN